MKGMLKRQLITALVFIVAAPAIAVSAGAETLKASHQWPGGKGDVRDEMVQIIAREVANADVGLDVQVYPAKSLYKPKENHEHAKRLNDSPFMEQIKGIIDEAGVVVLSDAWLAGGFASKKNCILGPDTIKGQVFRAAGKAFNEMLAGAGASIQSMPSSEIYTALQTGVLDGANTSSGSFVSYRIFEQVTCLTAPGEFALWFMYEPILMSKQSFDSLTQEQQGALMAAGQVAEDFFFDAAKGLDGKLVEAYKGAGVEVVSMTAEQATAWRAIADQTSYKSFAEKVPGGRELIDKALAVE
jgi:TRAP-type C4-dicarboxylate transport system substrate-binding protein